MFKVEKGTLYIVATPIGNMGDITYRAVEVLREVDCVAAEDTRVSGKLLSKLEIKKPLISYYDHNKAYKGNVVTERLKKGESIALITDAGTPCVSDPGAELVKLCAVSGIPVVPIPGVSAAVTALSVCGMNSGRFAFEGFLPANKKKRAERIEKLKTEDRETVIYTAPHDALTDITDLYNGLGDRETVICREMTKLNESYVYTTLGGAVKLISDGEVPSKGEFAIVIRASTEKALPDWAKLSVLEHIALFESQGMAHMDAIKAVAAERGMSKREVYGIALSAKDADGN